jgi:hypothetical protein
MSTRINSPACHNLQVLTSEVLQQLGRYLAKQGSNSKAGQLHWGTQLGQLLEVYLGKLVLAQQEPYSTQLDSTLVLVVLGTQHQAQAGMAQSSPLCLLPSGQEKDSKSWR